MLKTMGAGVAIGLAGLGYSQMAHYFKPKKIDFAQIQESKLYPELEKQSAYALEQNEALNEIVQQLKQYFHFDFEVGQEFVRVAADLAEFMARREEIEKKRSIPKQFRAFTSTLMQRVRELRRAIREKSPMLLEEFDEAAAELTTFQSEQHHNLWCDAHPD